LLQAEGLPVEDLTEAHLDHFFYCGDDDAPSGLVGVELFGEQALMRSLVVSSAVRSQGIGSALVQHAEAYAAAHGVRAIYLLTTTADLFFEYRGYRAVDRTQAPSSIQLTREFAGLCPESSIVMLKQL